MKEYRYYCEDESSYIYELSETIPTVCKNNASHIIRDVVFVSNVDIGQSNDIIVDESQFSGELDGLTDLQSILEYIDQNLNNSGGNALPQYYDEASSESESQTNSSNYQEKLELNTSILAVGKYRIGWYLEFKIHQSAQFMARVQVDNIDTLMEIEDEADNSNSWESVSGFKYYIISNEKSIEIDLDYKPKYAHKTAHIRRARLEIMRVE